MIAATALPPNLMIVDAELALESGVSAVERNTPDGASPHTFINGDAERVRLRKPNARRCSQTVSGTDSPEPLI